MGVVLRIDSSSRTENSNSRKLGDYFEKAWMDKNREDRVLRRDLVISPIPHITAKTITGFYTPAEQLTKELQEATALSDELIEELQLADVLLITVPMYNFTVPSSLKAWIDHIVRIGRTFFYDGTNFTGLVTNKRAYVICAYGAGGYQADGVLSSFNFLEPYIKALLNFLGIQNVQFFCVEATTADEVTVKSNTLAVQNEIDAAVAIAKQESL